MKIIPVIVCALSLMVAGCKREVPLAAAPSSSPAADKPVNWQQPSSTMTAPLAISKWDKVKITSSGDIFVNKKQMSLTDFAAECQQLKREGGAVMFFTGEGDHVINGAQLEAVHKLLEAQLPVKAVQKESELD